jgi:hypothetical protein
MTITWPGRSDGSSTSETKQHLRDEAEERRSVHPPIEGAVADDALGRDRTHDREVLPTPVGDAPVDPPPTARATVATGHGDVGPRLVEEHEAQGLHLGLLAHEGLPLGPDIVAVPLVGAERLFFSVSPSVKSARLTAIRPTDTPRSASSRRASSSAVASGVASIHAASAARSSSESVGRGPRGAVEGATEPVVRQSRLIFWTKERLTPKRSATARSVASPRRAASRTRWRRSVEKAAMRKQVSVLQLTKIRSLH